MKPSLRNPPRNRGYFSRSPRAFCIEKYNISRSSYHSKFHRILRLPRKVTLQLYQIQRLPRKMTLQHFKEISGKQLKRHFQCGADPSRIRE